MTLRKMGEDYESFNEDFIESDVVVSRSKQFYNTLSENTRESVEVLRNIFEGEYYQDIKARSELNRQELKQEEKGLDDTVDNNQFSQGEMIDEEYNQQSMTHFA